MMSNLFSVFDPSTTLMNISLNWLSTGLLFFMIPVIFWLTPSRIMMLWNMVSVVLYKEFKILLGIDKLTVGGTLLFISLFFFILFNNFMGLFSYVFTSSSHLVMNLSLALPLWMSFMIFGWFNYSIYMFAHLVPQGTPSLLMPFMVCIETISNLIRPGTLAIRLTANMIAGHLLMTLLGNMGSGLSTMLVSGLLVIQILLLSLELAVAIIQSYVFAVLSTLYAKEVV